MVLLAVAVDLRLLHQQQKRAPAQPPRKLMYVVDKAKRSLASGTPNISSTKRGLEQKPVVPAPPSLHLNKSFVVSRGHMEKLRKLTQQQRSPKVNGRSLKESHHSHSHHHSRKLSGDHNEEASGHGGVELEENHKQLQSTPLLLIGDYEIIVEKKDEI